MPLVLNGTTGVQDNSGAFVRGTAVASTSGTSIDFTSIPSWVKRITVVFNGTSTNGSSLMQVQIGSGSVTTSGYTAARYGFVAGGGIFSSTATTGFLVGSDGASQTVLGNIVLTNISGNDWIQAGLNSILTTTMTLGTGVVSISGALDRVRITTVNGTDTFDAGSINILYE
jgi:hypothetical protein